MLYRRYLFNPLGQQHPAWQCALVEASCITSCSSGGILHYGVLVVASCMAAAAGLTGLTL